MCQQPACYESGTAVFQSVGGIILPIQENLQFTNAGKSNFKGLRASQIHMKQSQNRTNYKFFLVFHFSIFKFRQAIPASMSVSLT